MRDMNPFRGQSVDPKSLLVRLTISSFISFQFTNRQKLTCQMSGEERQTPWEHGAAIAKAIKSVEIEGLTGPIR